MKIVFISDIHNKFAAIPQLPKADLLLIGGDFTQFGSDADVAAAIKNIEASFPQFLAVAGNLDPKTADGILAASRHFLGHASPSTVQGLRIAGISGCNATPFNSPYEWKEEDMAEQTSQLQPGSLDILVSHTPPFGSGADVIPSGANVGSKTVAALAQRLALPLLLCGHIHEAAGIFPFHGCTVVNPGPLGEEGNYALIDYAPGSVPKVTLLKAKTCF